MIEAGSTAAARAAFTLRRLVPADAAAYRALMLEAYATEPDAFTSTVAEREPLPLAWWAARLGGGPMPETVIGACDGDGALVGAAGLRFETRQRLAHKCTLFGLYVRPAARAHGVGGAIVRALLESAAERSGVRIVQLTVSEGNVAAEALYRRCGFICHGREPAATAGDAGWVTKLHLWHPLGVPVDRYDATPVVAPAPSPAAPATVAPPAQTPPRLVDAVAVPPRTRPSNYPPTFAARMAGREKRALGDVFGLTRFGVNLTRLAPGAASSLRHRHEVQDEFVFVLQGRPTLHDDRGATVLAPGQCVGFAHGSANAHCLRNEGTADAWVLEVGDRTPGDRAHYPDDDLRAEWQGGGWRFVHRDGLPY